MKYFHFTAGKNFFTSKFLGGLSLLLFERMVMCILQYCSEAIVSLSQS